MRLSGSAYTLDPGSICVFMARSYMNSNAYPTLTVVDQQPRTTPFTKMPQFLQRDELERRLLEWGRSVRRYPFFEGPVTSTGVIANGKLGSAVDDLRRWFDDIEFAANDCSVPLEQYPDVAIHFLRGDLKEVMTKRREAYIKETNRGWWDWKDFKEDLKRIVG